MSNVGCFTNDNFRVLSYLFDLKGKDNYARTTQQEIADALGLSRVTTNRIMKQLKEEEYIEQDKLHIGRYLVTEKAISAVATFRKSDNKNS